MSTFKDFITVTGIALESKFKAYVQDAKWPHFEWECTLVMPGSEHRLLTTPYKLGVGHCTLNGKGVTKLKIDRTIRAHVRPRDNSLSSYEGHVVPKNPELADLLNSLQSDCAGGDQSFEEFCGDFGYDTDSRKAYATWEACTQIRGRMRSLLRQHYNLFLECTEE